MPELSVIIPFVNEWPHILYTVASITEELRDRVDYELLLVDNFCDEVASQNYADKSHDYFADHSIQKVLAQSNIKVFNYKEKLSHWQAKNLGVANAQGQFLFFCDAHCSISRNSLFDMFQYYKKHHIDGSLHLPLTYQLLDSRRLMYGLVTEPEKGVVHYRFVTYPGNKNNGTHFKVSCMSTCGMMITRDIYKLMGGWPVELGIYGGGENFFNFTLAVLGKTINMFATAPLKHHGDRRKYCWNHNDYVRNRCIATYIFGGKAWAKRYMRHAKGHDKVLSAILADVLEKCRDHRELIKSRQEISVEDWLKGVEL